MITNPSSVATAAAAAASAAASPAEPTEAEGFDDRADELVDAHHAVAVIVELLAAHRGSVGEEEVDAPQELVDGDDTVEIAVAGAGWGRLREHRNGEQRRECDHAHARHILRTLTNPSVATGAKARPYTHGPVGAALGRPVLASESPRGRNHGRAKARPYVHGPVGAALGRPDPGASESTHYRRPGNRRSGLGDRGWTGGPKKTP